jgi:hypothetical protein
VRSSTLKSLPQLPSTAETIAAEGPNEDTSLRSSPIPHHSSDAKAVTKSQTSAHRLDPVEFCSSPAVPKAER